jgi:hypothetical protein
MVCPTGQHKQDWQRNLNTMKSKMIGALGVAAMSALASAAPAAATPDSSTAANAGCGTTMDTWSQTTLTGIQNHWDGTGFKGGSKFPTRIEITDKGIVNWKIDGVGDVSGHDRMWIEGNSARFRSDMGRGFGSMIEFKLHNPVCTESGRLISSHITTDNVPYLLDVLILKSYFPLTA